MEKVGQVTKSYEVFWKYLHVRLNISILTPSVQTTLIPFPISFSYSSKLFYIPLNKALDKTFPHLKLAT